jgi:hypothetical protein
MAGLVPAIHDLDAEVEKTWMPGSRPGMTSQRFEPFDGRVQSAIA